MAEDRPKSRATALAPGDEAPWQDLPAELLPRILAGLPTNEVPCTARLVCKAAAAALRSPAHTTVRLSQTSPHGEFVRRWGAPGALRPLTLNRRRRLLCLTAASGCLHNLTWLAEHAGCLLDDSVLEAAAAADRLVTCRWLLQQGCTGLSVGLAAAAGAGQRSTLEALLADPGALALPNHFRDDILTNLASFAARGGHVGLMEWLLERFWLSGAHFVVSAAAKTELLAAAAAGCDLPTLQRLHLAHQPQLIYRLGLVLGCAASSRTPDWKAKVEWAEACLGSPLDRIAYAKAATCPDALERLAWLRARGCPCDWQAVTSAAGAGNVEALSYLLAEGCDVHFPALRAAAAGGHLAALEVLHSHGLAANNAGAWVSAAADAAREGQLPAVRWMLERRLIKLQPSAPNQENYSLLGAAAQSGSIELLALLRAGLHSDSSYLWAERDLYAAAHGGSEEALEWAVAQGCPVQESMQDVPNDDPYLIAAVQGDWATVACLRRLAVPWLPLNRQGGTFLCAVREGCSVPILRRLLELGCPVDWVQAADEAKYYHGEEVQTWLSEEAQQRSEEEGGLQQAVGEVQRQQ